MLVVGEGKVRGRVVRVVVMVEGGFPVREKKREVLVMFWMEMKMVC